MPIENKIHKLELLKPSGAKTLCGIEVSAIYPMSNSAMTMEAGKEPIRYTFFKGVTCKECKEKEE